MDVRTRWLSFLSLPFALLASLPAQDDGQLTLRAEVVPATAKPGDEVTLVLHAKVTPAWHAYGTRETINIPTKLVPTKVDLDGLEAAGEPQVPEGESHQTAIGEQFPLPNDFDVKWQLKVPASHKVGEVTIDGALTYQICNAVGCLPEDDADFTAKLVVTGANGAGETKPGLKLEPDAPKVTWTAAFAPASVHAGETSTLVIHVKVDPEWHAYGTQETNQIPVSFDPANIQHGGLELVGQPEIPPGEAAPGPGGVIQYQLPHEFDLKQQCRVPAGLAPGGVDVSGKFAYQICNSTGLCEPPTDGEFKAKLTVEAGAARATAVTPPVADSEPPSIDNPFGNSWWALIIACIGGGLFALAMPCTYPMIPITFSFFTKQAEKRHGNVLSLAIVYGLGIVAMFVLVGVGLSTVIIDVVNHWLTNTIIGVMFFFFAFVLFGWINLTPPQFVQNAAGKASRGGGLLGVFFMGATLVITSFTCTAPIVGSLIANIAAVGPLRVGIGMGIFGLTMALPFMFLALMPTKVKAMPRSGEWMETLKISLGFVELAAAFKFVSMVDFAFGWQILPRELFLFLWAAIFGLWAMYLFGILRKAGTVNEGVGNGRMAAGMFVTLLATYFLYGALGNQLDSVMTGFVPGYSKSLVSRAGGEGGAQHVALHTLIKDDRARAIEVAKAEDKLLLYNFTGFK